MHQRMPLSQASPWVRTPGAGILRTIWPVSGSIRKSFPEAGTAIQYLPSTHFNPCAPEGVVTFPYRPAPGVSNDFRVLPVLASTLRVLSDLVEPSQRPPFP